VHKTFPIPIDEQNLPVCYQLSLSCEVELYDFQNLLQAMNTSIPHSVNSKKNLKGLSESTTFSTSKILVSD